MNITRWFRERLRLTSTIAPQSSRAGDVRYCVDQFVVFGRLLRIAGWIWLPGDKLASLEIEFAHGHRLVLDDTGLPSPDVSAALGSDASATRFKGEWLLDVPSDQMLRARSVARFESGAESSIESPGTHGLAAQANHRLYGDFLRLLQSESAGTLLEIGSRARSGVTRREALPRDWGYVGLDVLAGPNVDVVGDAHGLSGLFRHREFSAVMAFSVLEHILMPWKLVVELNRVLRPGALGLFVTHQSWPMHDEPWDFWRFSSESWKGLLNVHTGFEIIEAAMGEPAYIVANCGHPVTDSAHAPSGFLGSAVLFRKTGDTRLEWSVDAGDVLDQPYPGSVSAVHPS